MAIIPLDTADDPRLAPYRNLKDRELASEGGRFIAQGQLVVERLLASDYPVESVLVAQKKAATLAALTPAHVPVYTLPDESLNEVVGFKFHRGALAVGLRRASVTIDELMQTVTSQPVSDPLPLGGGGLGRGRQDKPPSSSTSTRPITLAICPDTRVAENLGALIRTAAALGVTALLLGPQCTDPFWRRTIRVSMGAVFSLPIVQTDNLQRDLQHLREQWNVHVLATVTDEDATPLHEITRPLQPDVPDRLAVIFGCEDQGLDEKWLRACDQRLTIPMHHGTDSLNLTAAAAIVLHHLTAS